PSGEDPVQPPGRRRRGHLRVPVAPSARVPRAYSVSYPWATGGADGWYGYGRSWYGHGDAWSDGYGYARRVRRVRRVRGVRSWSGRRGRSRLLPHARVGHEP